MIHFEIQNVNDGPMCMGSPNIRQIIRLMLRIVDGVVSMNVSRVYVEELNTENCIILNQSLCSSFVYKFIRIQEALCFN